jgi:hypothetical protein
MENSKHEENQKIFTRQPFHVTGLSWENLQMNFNRRFRAASASGVNHLNKPRKCSLFQSINSGRLNRILS